MLMFDIVAHLLREEDFVVRSKLYYKKIQSVSSYLKLFFE